MERNPAAVIADAFNATGGDRTIILLELNHLSRGYAETIIEGVRDRDAQFVMTSDIYTQKMAEKIADELENSPVMLDAKTARFEEIRSTINELLEPPTSSRPEWGQ